MKTGRLQQASAVIFLTSALVNGGNAHNCDEEASQAKSVEQTYLTQGNQQQAAEWSVYGDYKEHDRNTYLGLAVLNLGLAASLGALGASMVRRSIEEEQEATQPTQTTPEA